MTRVATIFITIFISTATIAHTQKLTTSEFEFGPFDSSYYTKLAVISPATISNTALQVTPDSAGNFTLANRSGRVFFQRSFKLWEEGRDRVASFNSSFLINIFLIDGTNAHGEGLAFLIAPDISLPPASDGQYLGLTNSTTDGHPDNHLMAIELDTFKQDFDPDDNHVGLNINSVRSNQTVSLSNLGIQLAPNGTEFHMVWVEYHGHHKKLNVYMASQYDSFPSASKPSQPVLTAHNLDLKAILNQNSYFGFAASTGSAIELNCVLRWNLTVEILPSDYENRVKIIGLGAGIPIFFIVILLVCGLGYYLHKRRVASSGPNILGALKSLPGTPREFGFKDLKKATNNFDEKQKLGQGGFGVVYKGLLPKENLQVAVKMFSRDNLKGQNDFLAELTIINRLRHRHLVRLLGWCHKNGMLLLVYEYMPNGSLDDHLFCGIEKIPLGWSLRYNIIQGVASALHYLHHEYDEKVVHRDLKASNIMLDSNFNARLGDFGLARALENGKTSYAELEGVPGTVGYIAPECLHSGKATGESDVYGFGAVLLEVVCGQRPWTKRGGFHSLVDWVWWLHREVRILEAVDERLGNDFVVEEAERLLQLGLACSHPIASERPKTEAILQIISGTVSVPHVPPFKPAFVWPSTQGLGPSSFNISTTSSMVNTSDTTPITSPWTSQYVSRESYLPYTDSSSPLV
ncbi:Pkinase domain-containing protein/Lectin_legB domain-containing protein [Cephalotus follicularis]|uniref:Pkinase domain-containing protein/Lectin_legB domain-containing protein n=1 Tax=Cephalotus follicularis TaxID=3775 RepID=A0A1Q3C2A1_CEPFO|nr:Pkinase domain-containing protein/Lectin_legB domain-containing protein [Cephalotus follicularis]